MGRTLRSSLKPKSQLPSVSRSSEQNGVVQPTKPSKQKYEAEVGSSAAVSENVVVVSENAVAVSSLSDAPDTSGLPKESEEKTVEVAELEFEAKSLRDEAWYDVAMFLAHRVLNSGELEVRVRFQGFGAEEDEWVNVKNAVRERSIPLEASDCRKVRVGDLVLCFQENSDQAMYFDAHIVEIERKLHDIRGCRCLFSVRYDHDQTEEKVHAHRLCRRPAY